MAEGQEPQAPPPDRSRRAVVIATVGIVVIMGVALFIGAVVVPVVQVHKAIGPASQRLSVHKEKDGSYGIGVFSGIPAGTSPPVAPVEMLGGEDAAVRKVRIYLMMPRKLVKRREAVFLLRRCGPKALDVLVGLLNDGDVEIRRHAAWALGEIGSNAVGVEDALKGMFKDPDEFTRVLALQAVAKIHEPGIGGIQCHPNTWKRILEEVEDATD